MLQVLEALQDYALANPDEINLLQRSVGEDLYAIDVAILKGLALVHICLDDGKSEIEFHVNSKLVLRLIGKLNLIIGNQEVILERVKQLHNLTRTLKVSLEDFKVASLNQFKAGRGNGNAH
jgi:hypothetical protein